MTTSSASSTPPTPYELAQARCPTNFKSSRERRHGMSPRVTKRGNAANKRAQRLRNLAERGALNRGDTKRIKKG